MHFKIADLARDKELLDQIQSIGDRLFTESPDAVRPLCDRWLGTAIAYAEV
jgi:ATP-dependent DNA helicase RecG